MDSVEVNSGAIYAGFQSVNYAKKTMSTISNLMSAKNIDNKLIKELGFDGNKIVNDFGKAYSKLMEFYSQLVETKKILLQADPNNEYLFKQIDLQFKGMDLGDEPSETDYASYINSLREIYYIAKDREQNDSSSLSDFELSVINTYESMGLDEYDSYTDLLAELDRLKQESDKLRENDKVGGGMGGYTIHTNDRAAEVEKRLAELTKEKLELEKSLKEKGLLELNGLDELKIAAKQFVGEAKELANNVSNGDFESAGENLKTMLATGAVVVEKVYSGVAKIAEYIDDGMTMLTTLTAAPGARIVDAVYGTNYADEMWESTMDYVSIDRVGNMEKLFFEGTDIGKKINDNSLLKYDSKGAELIKNISVKGVEMAAATIITIATGGTAAPLVAAGVGFLEGFGKGGEDRFSLTDENGNYTNREAKDWLLAGLDGVQKAADWYVTGQTISTVYGGVKAFLNPTKIGTDALKTVTGNSFKDGIINTIKSPDIYVDLAAASAKAGAGYVTTGEVDWKTLALDMGFAVLGNFAGEYLSAAGTNKLLKDQNIPSTDEISEMVKFASTKDSIDSIREVEYSLRRMMEKYGIDYDASLHRLELLISEHDYNMITRYGGARDLIKKYSIEELDEMYKQLVKMKNLPTSVVDDIQNSITMMVNKYWLDPDAAFKRIELLIKNKDYSYLSGFDSIENLLKKYSFEDLELAYKKFAIKDIKVKSIKPISSNRTTKFFDELNVDNSNFGVNQGCLYSLCEYEYKGQKYSYADAKEMYNACLDNGLVPPAFVKRGNKEYMRLKDKLKSIYGFDSDDASIIISSVDDAGACSYASVCNEIFYYFRNDPVAFKNQFGFDMFRVVDGKKTLNSTELLLDMYVNINKTELGGNFFQKQLNGTYSIRRGFLSAEVDPLGRRILDGDKQIFLATRIGRKTDKINKYLSTKSIKYDSTIIFRSNITDNEKEFEKLLRQINDNIENGYYQYSIGIYRTDKRINMISMEGKRNYSTFDWDKGSGHSVYVTGLTNDGFVVSSWGEKFLIPYNDILNSEGANIYCTTIWR